jgi:heavy metal sensor kinase
VAWYTVLSGLTLLLFDLYLYFKFRDGLLKQVDRTLEVAAIQAMNNIDDEETFLTFDPRRDAPVLASLLDKAGVSVYLLNAQGTIKGQFGHVLTLPITAKQVPGFQTLQEHEGPWRFYTLEIPPQDDRPAGWIKVGHSLADVERSSSDLRHQMLWGTPLVLVLVGAGGCVLASQVLAPIDQMTRTARRIRSSGDLSQRIHYRGSPDELGRLAVLFDEMLDSLQQTFEREQRFSADVSHELRTPLTVLKGRLAVALSQCRSATEYQDTLHSIEPEVERLIRLSSDLLLLSQLERRHPEHPETVDLSDLLAAIAEQVQPLADLKAIHLATIVPPNLLIQGHPDHLIRLFLNLLDNAIKHTPTHGKVQLTVQQQAQTYQIAIQDSGPGIAAEHLPHLFERFYRVESDRSRLTGGAGLGLAIAQEIAHIHGGSITVHSTPSQGTTFWVTFPVSANSPF